ncbi:hypothetical protein RB195_018497 [Necator americanus]|uniref:Ezrin/radixin/moesin C-terminal domain-containing protein n=1 Tax=Necator americanus TaxID=51031 RepID=A0ABR1CBP8_NECAM
MPAGAEDVDEAKQEKGGSLLHKLEDMSAQNIAKSRLYSQHRMEIEFAMLGKKLESRRSRLRIFNDKAANGLRVPGGHAL